MRPALEKLGLNKMAVHMFIFYWGMLSAITPPVAIASFAAAGIAGAPPMRTGWESMWVGSIIYFIPFFFVLNPALVLQGEARISKRSVSPLMVAIGIALHLRRHPGLSGRHRRPAQGRLLEWPLRVMLVIGGFVFATPGGGIMPLSELTISSLGLALIAPAAAIAWLLVRRDTRLAPSPAAQ